LGLLAYICLPTFRKQSLNHLALASDLQLTSDQLKIIAKESFQNLALTCLNYERLFQRRSTPKIVCTNPDQATSLYRNRQGMIFFCGHLFNWEALFLDGTTRMEGIAFGKPLKNPYLSQWITSIREQRGGKMIVPKGGIFRAVRALKQGKFVGIVGDQGMPGSGYSSLFLGRPAWTSPTPAFLSYETGAPLIFASTRPTKQGYEITYSDPIWPNQKTPIDQEVPRLMCILLNLLQQEILRQPGNWLWMHNRWKQQTPSKIYKRFRHDAIGIILSERSDLLTILTTLKHLYPYELLFVYLPLSYRSHPLPMEVKEVHYYQTTQDLLQPNYRFKLLLNFTHDTKLTHHFKRYSTIEALDEPTMRHLALHQNPHLHFAKTPIELVLYSCLTRSGQHAS
jgi:KDO2-lipid IV(A) lauroyltransferase